MSGGMFRTSFEKKEGKARGVCEREFLSVAANAESSSSRS